MQSNGVDDLSAVHDQDAAGHVGARLGGEQQWGARQVAALSEAPLRDSLDESFGEAGVLELAVHLRFDVSRTQDIDADVLAGELVGHDLGQVDEPGLGGAITDRKSTRLNSSH